MPLICFALNVLIIFPNCVCLSVAFMNYYITYRICKICQVIQAQSRISLEAHWNYNSKILSDEELKPCSKTGISLRGILHIQLPISANAPYWWLSCSWNYLDSSVHIWHKMKCVHWEESCALSTWDKTIFLIERRVSSCVNFSIEIHLCQIFI